MFEWESETTTHEITLALVTVVGFIRQGSWSLQEHCDSSKWQDKVLLTVSGVD